MNVKSVGSSDFREADNMFNLKKGIAMGFHPMIDRGQRALLCARLIWRHHEDVAVKLRELIRVISAEIGKKELLDSGRSFRAKTNRVAIAIAEGKVASREPRVAPGTPNEKRLNQDKSR
jgi:hypothetical protein